MFADLRRALGVGALVAVLVSLTTPALSAGGRGDVTIPKTETPTHSALADTLTDAVRALDAGDLETAERKFEAARRLDPNTAGALLGLAQTMEAMKRPAEAIGWLRRAAELEPTPVVLTFAARLAARVDRPNEALGFFATLRERVPGDVSGYVGAALLLRDLERPAEAIELLEVGLEAELPGGTVERELGLLYLDEGRFDEAREFGLRAWRAGAHEGAVAALVGIATAGSIEAGGAPVSETGSEAEGADPLEPRTAVAWLEEALALGVRRESVVRLALAESLARGEEHREALAELDRVVELDPMGPQAHYQRALVLAELGEDAEAERALARFTELTAAAQAAENAGRSLGIALNEAQDLANRNELDAALERLELLAKEHPNFAPIAALRAKVLFSMGRRQEALAEIVRARKLSPALTEYHYLEAFFNAHLEQWTEAEQAALRALDLDPGLEEAKHLLDQIRPKLSGADRP